MNDDRERIEYLAAMAAAGAADQTELAELEQLESADPSAAQDSRAFFDTMAEVAMHRDFQAPSPTLFAKIEGRIGGKGADVISLASRRRMRMWQVSTIVGMASAAALAVLYLNQRDTNLDMHGRVATTITQLRLKEKELQQARSEFNTLSREYLAELDSKKSELDEAQNRLGVIESAKVQLATIHQGAGPTVKIFIEPEQKRWMVFAFDLPEIANKDYQLWFVPDGSSPVPAGIMKARGQGNFFAEVVVPSDIGTVKQAAISLEPIGGSTTPTEVKVIGLL